MDVSKIKMEPVESSNLEAVGYDEENSLLFIRFQKGGVYVYFKVPRNIYEALMAAPSKGRFFHQAIRGKYDYMRL